MGEWLKPTDLKSVKAARSSGVRIPLPPPAILIKYFSKLTNNNLQKKCIFMAGMAQQKFYKIKSNGTQG